MSAGEPQPPRLIDAHHHLWDLGSMRYPWLQDGPPVEEDRSGLAPIRKDYLVDAFRADAADVALVGSVHVEAAHDPSCPVLETQWLDRQAQATGLPTAIVAHARLEDARLANVLEDHAHSPRLRGIRQMLNWEPDEPIAARPDLLGDPAWEAGLDMLAERGLLFDLQVFPSQLRQAADVVERHPEVTFVLNHGGYLQRRTPERTRMWTEGIRRLGQLPNTAVKASSYASVEPSYSPDGLRRFLGELRSAFGPSRVLFGSNFPVDSRFIGYGEQVAAHARAVADWDPADQDRYFFANATELYRLPSS